MSQRNETPSPRTLIAALKARGELRDRAIEAAFLAVPRHLFLPNVPLDEVYSDQSISVKRDANGQTVSSSSQPTMMIIMLDQLKLAQGMNVLEIGGGTGYNAALMQHIVGDSGRVTTIELDKELVKHAQDALQRAAMTHINVVETDGVSGFPARASYDRIIATVGIWDVPRAWTQQLKTAGILVAPLWIEALQVSAAFTPQRDGTLYSADNRPCGFVHLRGVAAGPATQIRVGSSPLMLSSDSLNLDGAAVNALLSEDATDAYLGAALDQGEYWYGFVPYLMLHTPADFTFAGYNVVDEGQRPYGVSGSGFALMARGSACFVPIAGAGALRCYGGADAFLALQDALTAWEAAARPGINRLRLRLTPKTADDLKIAAPISAPNEGKRYVRRDHIVHAWMDR
ncbi:MAG: rRNA adenine N-6-methyltransferase family protein [Chloroflexota bacterium]|nr:rRNA adenine N-6-methyltransferase family protein [Chloroflexota bacterium]